MRYNVSQMKTRQSAVMRPLDPAGYYTKIEGGPGTGERTCYYGLYWLYEELCTARGQPHTGAHLEFEDAPSPQDAILAVRAADEVRRRIGAKFGEPWGVDSATRTEWEMPRIHKSPFGYNVISRIREGRLASSDTQVHRMRKAGIPESVIPRYRWPF